MNSMKSLKVKAKVYRLLIPVEIETSSMSDAILKANEGAERSGLKCGKIRFVSTVKK